MFAHRPTKNAPLGAFFAAIFWWVYDRCMTFKIMLGIAILVTGSILIARWLRPQGGVASQVEAGVVVAAEARLETVAASEFASALEADKERIIIDVRTPGEFANGRIAGAKNIDFYTADFINQFEQFDRSEPLAVYCRSGNRSGQALELLRQAGFTDVVNLSGGIVAWERFRPDGVCMADGC